MTQDHEMQLERREVDAGGNDDETETSSTPMTSIGSNGHFEIAKLVPQVFDGVHSDEGHDKETDPLDASNATDAETCKSQPEPPLVTEGPMLLLVEHQETMDSSKGKAQEHRVQEDEAGNDEPSIVAEDHQGQEVTRPSVPSEGA